VRSQKELWLITAGIGGGKVGGEKTMKRLCFILLTLLLIAEIFTISTSAVNLSIGTVLSTDINAYIDGVRIPSYNIDGKLAVIVSDLDNYGFVTKYDNALRKTSVTLDTSGKKITEIPSQSSNLPVGTPVMSVYASDIEVELDGEKVEAVNVDNRMAIFFTFLGKYGSCVYDNNKRASTLIVSRSSSTTEESLAVYSTYKYLYLDKVPVFGVVKVGNVDCIPLEMLDQPGINMYCASVSENNANELKIYMRASPGRQVWGETKKNVLLVDYKERPRADQFMGYAEKSSRKVTLNEKPISTVYTLGGRYPMIPVSALGATAAGKDYKVALDKTLTVVHEKDLLGEPLKGMLKATPEETIKAIHDGIIDHLVYDLEKAAAGITSPFSNLYNHASTYENALNYAWDAKAGVCEDFASLFSALCARAGIPCEKVTGQGGGGNHAWNRVYLNGEWKYVDVTFDDNRGTNGNLATNGVPTYDNYLKDPIDMVGDHWWRGDDYPLPLHYDPEWEKLDPMNITSADMFRKCFVAQLAQKKTHFEMRNTVPGAYSGTACLFQYKDDIGLSGFSGRGGYNSEKDLWIYDFEYGWIVD